MAGSGNSCTLSCPIPPVAANVSAFIRLGVSEGWAQDLLAGTERNSGGRASRRRRLQEEAEFHPAFSGISDLADHICQAVAFPGDSDCGNRVLRLKQRTAGAAAPWKPHNLGTLGAATALYDVCQIAI